MAVGLVGLLGYAAWLGRDFSFFSDEWPFIAFHHNGNYLTPYGGHLLLVPIAIYHTLFVTFGLRTYTPYRIVGLVSYAVLGAATFLYFRSRVRPPILAALAALSIIWFSAAQLNVLFPSLLNFSIPLVAIVAIWMLLDRDELRTDIVASGCLAVALASGGVGLVTAAVVGAELLLLRAPLRRWIPFGPPVALWLLWYAGYHTPVANPNSVGGTLRFALHQVQATFAAFAGGWDPGGYVLLAVAVLVFGVSYLRWHTFNARAASALAGIATFAVLTGYAARHGALPAVPADTPRYLWVDAFFLVSALIEVLRGRRISLLVPTAAAVIAVVGAITLVGNLRDYQREVLKYTHTTRTFMVVAEAIPDRINRRRIMPFSYNIVRVGDYLAAVRHLGSAVRDVPLVDLGSETDRRMADRWLIDDLMLRVVPGSPPTSGACRTAPRATRDVSVRGPATVVLRAGSASSVLSLRRLAHGYGNTLGRIRPDGIGVLQLPADRSSFPWHVRFDGVGASLSVCG
jgi:hypothetical protein